MSTSRNNAFQRKNEQFIKRLEHLYDRFRDADNILREIGAEDACGEGELNECFFNTYEEIDGLNEIVTAGYETQFESLWDNLLGLVDDFKYYRDKPNSSYFADKDYIRDNYDGYIRAITRELENMEDIVDQYNTYLDFCVYCRLLPVVNNALSWIMDFSRKLNDEDQNRRYRDSRRFGFKQHG